MAKLLLIALLRYAYNEGIRYFLPVPQFEDFDAEIKMVYVINHQIHVSYNHYLMD